jgi:hypothetical protein
MDSRIGIRLVAAVIEGDMSYARRLRGLYRGAPKGKARIAAALARLPVPMGRIAVTAGRKIKALVARSANSA